MAHNGWHVDMAAVRNRRQKMIDGLQELHLNNFRKSGAAIIMGFGHFVAQKIIQVGPGVSDLLVPVQVVMSANLPYTALRDIVVAHPTMGEGFISLFSAVPAKKL